MTGPILIVGGGLAGLIAALLLNRSGVAFQLLEARDRLGGRILSVDATGQAAGDGFDLGPSWFWPDMQPRLAALVAELGLSAFAQHNEGDAVNQRARDEAPVRHRGMRQEPQSMRLEGGTGALVRALASGLPASSIRLGARVTRIARAESQITISLSTGETLSAAQVILALPPRLIEATVTFSPPLDATIARRWRDTPTWMAPHAKFFAVYERPFWRAAGLSGAAHSQVGPLVEIHDATTAAGAPALFGFVGVPASQRSAVGEEAIVTASVRQLAAIFGHEAARPKSTLFKDWAADPLTATADDVNFGGHPSPDRRPWVSGPWQEHLRLAGSETSITEPGYLAGAVEAAQRAVHAVLERRRARTARLLGRDA